MKKLVSAAAPGIVVAVVSTWLLHDVPSISAFGGVVVELWVAAREVTAGAIWWITALGALVVLLAAFVLTVQTAGWFGAGGGVHDWTFFTVVGGVAAVCAAWSVVRDQPIAAVVLGSAAVVLLVAAGSRAANVIRYALR